MISHEDYEILRDLERHPAERRIPQDSVVYGRRFRELRDRGLVAWHQHTPGQSSFSDRYEMTWKGRDAIAAYHEKHIAAPYRARYGRRDLQRRRDRDRLFIGVFPTGISYADRGREKHGDYARCAFLDFRTLTLDVKPDCPRQLREEIVRHAKSIQARRGERFETSTSGQSVVLGAGRDPRRLRSRHRRDPMQFKLDPHVRVAGYERAYRYGPDLKDLRNSALIAIDTTGRTWYATVWFRNHEVDFIGRSSEEVLQKATDWVDAAPELSRWRR